MAMTVLNNTAAALTIGELNKNITLLGKQLKKVSSGMKLTSAEDGAAEYAISEKMRTRLRALTQNRDNVAKGRNLVDEAAALVDSQVDIMKKVATISMKASDDAYTDSDRATLQKECGQLLDQVEQIAQTSTYNGHVDI